MTVQTENFPTVDLTEHETEPRWLAEPITQRLPLDKAEWAVLTEHSRTFDRARFTHAYHVQHWPSGISLNFSRPICLTSRQLIALRAQFVWFPLLIWTHAGLFSDFPSKTYEPCANSRTCQMQLIKLFNWQLYQKIIILKSDFHPYVLVIHNH